MPFEGDLTLWLRSLPQNAQVTKAVVTVSPAVGESETTAEAFEIRFDPPGSETWGATRSPDSQDQPWASIDLHARRTITAILATRPNDGSESPSDGSEGGLEDESEQPVTVQISLGGNWVTLADDGSILGPDKSLLILDLPPNPVSKSISIPPVTTEKIQLTAINNTDDTSTNLDGEVTVQGLTISSSPTNVSFSLGASLPFWTRLGELSTAATSPDFSVALNGFLTTATAENGFYAIPLVVHSDAISRLDIRIQIDYVLYQRALPPHLPEATVPFTFGTVPAASQSLLRLSFPPGAIPRSASATIQGEFKPTRIAFGPVGALARTVAATVSPQCSLAQPILIEQEIAIMAVDLLFSKVKANLAGLHISIQSDADGKPSGEVLTTAEVIVTRPVPPEELSWGSATLTEPLRVSPLSNAPHQRYWVVLQSQSGEANWQVEPGVGPGLQCTDTTGLTWRVATVTGEPHPLKAQLRLRHQPEQFTVPVQLQIGAGPTAIRRRLDEFAPLGRIEFQFDFTDKLADYIDQVGTPADCSHKNLLINGDFTLPPSEDATFKLLDIASEEENFISLDNENNDDDDNNFYARLLNLGYYSSQSFIGKTIFNHIDLSTQRFITLSINNQRPIRIDCAGIEPSRTQRGEIVTTINNAVGRPIVTIDDDDNRLEISVDSFDEFTERIRLYLGCSTTMPIGWQGIAGQILRLQWLDSINRFSVLLMHPSFWEDNEIELPCFPPINSFSNTSETSVSFWQRVSCQGGCTYLLQFNYGLLEDRRFSNNGFIWQVTWFDSVGNSISTDKATILSNNQDKEEEEDIENTTGSLNSQDNEEDQFFQFQEIRVSAPKDAIEAEIRFEQAAPGGLILDEVAFISSTEALSNSRFLLTEDGLLTGWQILDGQLAPDKETASNILRGDSNSPQVLTQTVDIVPETGYSLYIKAYFQDALPTNFQDLLPNQRARLELHWQGKSNPITLLLDEPGFPSFHWAGSSPADVTQADIRLVQPYSQALTVETISLSRLEPLDIPLVFLSEAPGDLVLSDKQIGYETPAARPLINPIFQSNGQSSSPDSSATDPTVDNISTSASTRALGGTVQPLSTGLSQIRSETFEPISSTSDTATGVMAQPLNTRISQIRSEIFEPAASSDSFPSKLFKARSTIVATELPVEASNHLHQLPPSFAKFLVDVPESGKSKLLQGYSFAKEQDYTAAISAYNQVLDQTQGYQISVLTHLLLGDTYVKNNQYPQALASYNKFIQFMPRAGYAYYQRGLIQIALGNKQAALVDFSQAVEIFQQQERTEDSQKLIRKIEDLKRRI